MPHVCLLLFLRNCDLLLHLGLKSIKRFELANILLSLEDFDNLDISKRQMIVTFIEDAVLKYQNYQILKHLKKLLEPKKKRFLLSRK